MLTIAKRAGLRNVNPREEIIGRLLIWLDRVTCALRLCPVIRSRCLGNAEGHEHGIKGHGNSDAMQNLVRIKDLYRRPMT